MASQTKAGFFSDEIPVNKSVHIASENEAFRWWFFILLIGSILVTCGTAPFNFVTLSRTLMERSSVNSLAQLLSTAHIVENDCWICDAKTGILTFISNIIESDLTGTSPTTSQFPDDVSFNEVEFGGNSPLPMIVNGLDMTVHPSGQTLSAAMILGNASKYTSSGVTGLPSTSTSTMNVGIYNGDATLSNSRCSDFIHSRIYLMYKFNILVNASDFYLCVCVGIESCLKYDAASFTIV
jgi:hypothetical protein